MAIKYRVIELNNGKFYVQKKLGLFHEWFDVYFQYQTFYDGFTEEKKALKEMKSIIERDKVAQENERKRIHQSKIKRILKMV